MVHRARSRFRPTDRCQARARGVRNLSADPCPVRGRSRGFAVSVPPAPAGHSSPRVCRNCSRNRRAPLPTPSVGTGNFEAVRGAGRNTSGIKTSQVSHAMVRFHCRAVAPGGWTPWPRAFLGCRVRLMTRSRSDYAAQLCGFGSLCNAGSGYVVGQCRGHDAFKGFDSLVQQNPSRGHVFSCRMNQI